MIKNNYIGITGFTEKEQILDTLKTIESLPKEQNYMFGFLVSKKTLNLEPIENKRYLNFKSYQELKELMTYSSNKDNILNMIHFNTNEREFSKELIPLLKELGDVVEAIQFNLSFIEIEQYKIIRKQFPNIKFLLQYNNSFEKNLSAYEIYYVLKEIGFEYILIDLSGGRGTSFEPIYLKKAYDEFGIEKLETNLGVAGGLSGENVQKFINELNQFNIPYFIDSESKLRDKLSDKYGDDIWNQSKVDDYITKANIK